MKRFLSLLFFVFLVGCGTEQKEEQEIQEEEIILDPILSPYLSAVDALVSDDYAKAKELGAELQKTEAANGVQLAFKSMGRLLYEASSLYDQRTILEQMTLVMQLYIEQEIINDYPIYKFQCKSEFEDKVLSWYGLDKSSKNPYIGENSTECIELIETIKPVIRH